MHAEEVLNKLPHVQSHDVYTSAYQVDLHMIVFKKIINVGVLLVLLVWYFR